MKKTFACDESMIITIPIGSLRDAGEGQLMPEKFQCVYKDSYKIFKHKIMAASLILLMFVFLIIFSNACIIHAIFTLQTKLSFSLNIVSFFWSVAAVCLLISVPFPLIYWLSKAVCRQHFNTLPIILLKQGD
uniref:Uncharacterized protein n=1 Tax=Sander lucioperca TaxID=283035 RepID=A0A8D0CSE2_SANLU